MKKIITLFISILFMIGCNTNKSKIETDLEKQGFKGKVKSIKSTTYKAIEKFGEIQKGEKFSGFFYTFNKDGNFIECISDEKENNSRQTFIYNDKGNIIEQKEYDSEGSLKSQTTYNYDDKGREVESLITLSFQGINGSAELRITKEYDQKGNIIEEKNYNNHNKLSSKGIYTYDERGNKIKEIFINLDSKKPEEKNIYIYDKNNNKIEVQEYISENLSEKTIIKYDEKGNILEKDLIDFNKNMSFKIIYKNDKIGNSIEQIYYVNGNLYVIEEIEIEYYN